MRETAPATTTKDTLTMIPTDSQILAHVDMARAGTFDSYTRDKIGGGTVARIVRATIVNSGRNDCGLCGRALTGATGTAGAPVLHHMVPAAWHTAARAGYIVRGSAVAHVGYGSMVVACNQCNMAAGDRVILPSMLTHTAHIVTGDARLSLAAEWAPEPDVFEQDRIARLGW